MTNSALEAMAKAYWDCSVKVVAMVDPDHDWRWEAQKEDTKRKCIFHMRSALLALSEVELPESAMDAACAMNDMLVRNDFKAIIRSLAEEK